MLNVVDPERGYQPGLGADATGTVSRAAPPGRRPWCADGLS